MSDLSYFANDAERRHFITIGAARGFAARFGAPIGGLLFILDDISSFFEPNMFFCFVGSCCDDGRHSGVLIETMYDMSKSFGSPFLLASCYVMYIGLPSALALH